MLLQGMFKVEGFLNPFERHISQGQPAQTYQRLARLKCLH